MRRTFMTGLFVAMVLPVLCAAQLHTVTAAEYFWDNDPGVGNGTPFAITADDTVTIYGDLISTAGLLKGPHLLQVRVRRDDGVWGEPTTRKVYVGIGNELDDAEIFFDGDPGEGNGISVSVSAQGVVNETDVDVPDIGSGFHRLNLRTYSGGTWSSPVSNVLRLGSALIDGAEVFFDTDPGEGNGIPVAVTSPAEDVSVYETELEVAALGTGFRKAFMRFRGGGVWSFPRSSILRVTDEVPGSENYIAAAEFFVDVDPGEGNGCPLLAEDGTFDELDELIRRYVLGESLGAGEHVVSVRAQDAAGRWTITQSDTVKIDTAYVVIVPEVDVSDVDVLISWSTYPSATEYRVHYDTTPDGSFTSFISVVPPDTSLLLNADEESEFFRVIAIEPAPEPCEAERSPAAVKTNQSEITHR